MTTRIALFRGINVGGKHLLPMKALVALLEKLGCSNVRTYIQSGNVVFQKTGVKAPQLSKRIGETILSQHGFEPRVLLLSVKDLERAVAQNPFPAAEADPKTLHLSFLSAVPTSADLETMNKVAARSETFSLIGNVFYLHAPDGIGCSKLAAKAERLLGVDTTGRNWRTVCKLLELAKKNE